jgi:hypothetical protein
MKKQISWPVSIRLPWRPVVLALTLVFPGTGGCSKVDVAEWREEVELANGEIVVVKRSEVRDKSGFPASVRGVMRERKVVFPGGQPVWVNDGNMYAVAIEIRDSKAYIAVNIQSRELCKKFGDPPSSMLFYLSDGATWVQVKKEEFPANGKANLLVNPWGRNNFEDLRGLVRNKDKNLVKSYNQRVNQPLEKVLSSRVINACELLKNN